MRQMMRPALASHRAIPPADIPPATEDPDARKGISGHAARASPFD